MAGEIDRDFYCTAGNNPAVTCPAFERCRAGKESCFFRHRKWPAPEQFMEEYGREWGDDSAVYRLDVDQGNNPAWYLLAFSAAKHMNAFGTKQPIACACAPFGKPDADWRPS